MGVFHIFLIVQIIPNRESVFSIAFENLMIRAANNGEHKLVIEFYDINL